MDHSNNTLLHTRSILSVIVVKHSNRAITNFQIKRNVIKLYTSKASPESIKFYPKTLMEYFIYYEFNCVSFWSPM